jgi:photosystem II stability/assembly factor-like uncharacterized protein
MAVIVVGATASAYLKLGPFKPEPAPQTVNSLPKSDVVQFRELQVASDGTAWVFMTSLTGEPLLYASSNAGRSWSQLTVPQTVTFENQKYGIQVIDKTNGFLQLGRGLLSTVDGGHDWRQVPLPPGLPFGLGAHFLDSGKGWYQDLTAYPDQAAQPSSMWWTTNAGSSWRLLWRVDADHPSVGPLPLDATKFVLGFDGELGWLAVSLVDSESLVETVDGGRTWFKVALALPASAFVYEIQTLHDGSAVLLARSGSQWFAITSRDQGRTWQEQNSRPIPIVVNSGTSAYDRPALIDRTHWVVAEGSALHMTSDGGTTWHDTQARLPAGISQLHDLWLLGTGPGWATGTDATGDYHVLITRDDGATWSRAQVPHLS